MEGVGGLEVRGVWSGQVGGAELGVGCVLLTVGRDYWSYPFWFTKCYFGDLACWLLKILGKFLKILGPKAQVLVHYWNKCIFSFSFPISLLVVWGSEGSGRGLHFCRFRRELMPAWF